MFTFQVSRPHRRYMPFIYIYNKAVSPAAKIPHLRKSTLTTNVHLRVLDDIPAGIEGQHGRWHLHRPRLPALPLALRDMDLRLRFQFIQFLVTPGGEFCIGGADRERILGAIGESPVLVLGPTLVAQNAFGEAGVVGRDGGVRGADMAVESREDGHAGDDDADELFAEFEDGDGGDGDGLVGAFAGDDLVAEADDAGHDGDAADEEDGRDFPFLVRGHV